MKKSRCDLKYDTNVQFNSIEEITEFVRKAEKCEDNICLTAGTTQINAESILAVLALGTGKKLKITRKNNPPA